MTDKEIKMPKLFRDVTYEKNKEEFLHLDTLLNRKIIENTTTFLLGGTTALLIGGLFRVTRIFKGKFTLTCFSSGIACALLNYNKEKKLYDLYYDKWWKSLESNNFSEIQNPPFISKIELN